MRGFAGFVSAAIDFLMKLATIVAFCAAAVIVLLTLTDICLRNVDKLLGLATGVRSGWAIVGLVDISQMLTMLAAALSIAVAFQRGSHVAVDLLTAKLSPLGLLVTSGLAGTLSLVFVCGCFWAGWQAMQLDLEAATSSATIAIPYIYFWTPLLSGFLLSLFAIAFRLFDKVAGSTTDAQGGADYV